MVGKNLDGFGLSNSNILKMDGSEMHKELTNGTYLQDTSVTMEGLKIYGENG